MNSKIKVGIVGAKFAAQFHLEGYRRVYGVPIEVVGVTSRSRQSAEIFGKHNDIKVFDRLSDLLGAVDVVDICAPAYSHESVAIDSFRAGKDVIVEKPLTGFFGAGSPNFDARIFPKDKMLAGAVSSARRILEAADQSNRKLMYAENWVYAPSIQKECEVLRSTDGQILWILGEESHSGSHSPAYGLWSQAGGGSIVGKGCHPLTAALYLKRQEGLARKGQPLRPASVSARVHEVTRLGSYIDRGFLRTDYLDVEDFGQMHVVFEDGMIVLGGVHNWLEIMANNHRTRCNINPTNSLVTFNPQEEQLKDVYVVEKIGTKQGWTNPAPDEDWMSGYPQELQDFMECIYQNREPKCGGELAQDTVAVMYASYASAERRGEEVPVPRG